MKNIEMPADQMQHIMHKMYHKKRVLFRAFIINLGLIIIAWLTLICGVFSAEWLGRMMMSNPTDAMADIMMMVGIWDIAGVVLFLVPALAMWWECRCCKKELER